MTDSKTDLQKLATRVPERLLTSTKRGGKTFEAMDHTVVSQFLLLICGGYDFQIIEELYGPIETGKHATDRGLVGCRARLTVEIDGKTVKVEDYGGLENAGNIDGDGERGKHAASDALKRCARHLGLGLHVWAKSAYFLDVKLNGKAKEQELPDEVVAADPEIPDEEAVEQERPEVEESTQTPPPSDGIDLSEEELPSWLLETETPSESEYEGMKGAASAATEAKQPGKPGPGGDDGPCTDEQASAIRSLATQLKGESGPSDFEVKNGPIPRLTKRQAREHIRQLGEVVKRKNAKKQTA